MIRRVYKFGGASVRNADAVRNMVNILLSDKTDDLLIVVSAMGKTTNAIEDALKHFRRANGELTIEELSPLMEFHEKMMIDLFPDENHQVFAAVADLFVELYLKLKKTELNYDYQYDQTVSYGELISTTIIAAYLQERGFKAVWLDARDYIITDSQFRAATPDFDECRQRIQNINKNHHQELILTQGFIGSSVNPHATTTLGREGSDFTAAIFAYCLDAEDVTIWKDVDGIRNADPKRFPQTEKIDHLSYKEAIELSFYGASVIHPKTLKPLQNKNIPLKVKCFLDSTTPPTVIDGTDQYTDYCPTFIIKDNQTLVSISPRDFSFMNEHNLSTLFHVLNEIGIHANMIQTSALMLTICFDEDETRQQSLLLSLKKDFFVKYNENLTLLTIRHYRENIEKPLVEGRQILLEQKNRNSLQLILK